jgi:tRNA-dependent cyclodipeptide synthase
MQLHVVRSGKCEDVLAKRYNIAIGCSLGNKWFTPENVREATLWALDHARDRVCIYVADSIHGINISVRQHIPEEKARAKAMKLGEEFLKKVADALADLPEEQRKRIDLCTWKEVETPEYKIGVAYLYQLYEQDEEFHKAITAFVRNHVSKEARQFSDHEIDLLGTYILEELPACMNVIALKGTEYDAWAYPHDGKLAEFIEKLQNKEVFPHIAQHVLRKKKAFLEIR